MPKKKSAVRYQGILNEPMKCQLPDNADEHAWHPEEFQERIFALFKHYGLNPLHSDSSANLAMALAIDHIPNFKNAPQRNYARLLEERKDSEIDPHLQLIVDIASEHIPAFMPPPARKKAGRPSKLSFDVAMAYSEKSHALAMEADAKGEILKKNKIHELLSQDDFFRSRGISKETIKSCGRQIQDILRPGRHQQSRNLTEFQKQILLTLFLPHDA